MESKELALLAVKVLDKNQAIDIKVIDVMGKSSFADYLVIATGGNSRHASALVDYVDDELAKAGEIVKSIEGKNDTGWILMDFGDIIVNVFTEEMRGKYNVEDVWGDCELLELNLEGNE